MTSTARPDSLAWLSPSEDTAWRSFLAVSRAMERAVDRQLQRDSDLSGSEYEVLVPLSEAPEGRLPSRELLRHLGWERSRLSHMLSRMEKRGFLVRRSGCGDARGLSVELTAAGQCAIRAAAPCHLAMVRAAFVDRLDEQEMATLVAVARKVIPALDRLELT